MIFKLNDEEVQDILMTSDFDDIYKPNEFIFLLKKFRNFYRILWSNKENIKGDAEVEIRILKDELRKLSVVIGELINESEDKNKLIAEMENRKLTLRERISGKIIKRKHEN